MEVDNKLEDSVEPVSIEGTKIILKQMINCVCKIKIKERYGTGFFCKIPIGKEIIKAFMTNYHILNEKNIKENKKLNLLLNYEKNALALDLKIKRKIYFNKEYDITLIELKE